MIVKQRDALNSTIAYLDSHESPDMDMIQRQAMRQAAARLRADCTNSNACELIDHYFSDSSDWLVLHDLRIPHDNRILQINHLIISNTLDFCIVDSRYMRHALSFGEQGQCSTVSEQGRYANIASPLHKMQKDKRLLQGIIREMKSMPRVLGVPRTFNVHGHVITNPALRTHIPPELATRHREVITADALFVMLWENNRSWIKRKAGTVTGEQHHAVAQALLQMHNPKFSASLLSNKPKPQRRKKNTASDTAHCADCQVPVSAFVREQAFRHMAVCKGKVLCIECRARATTALASSVSAA